jgi:hypothetical protein
VQAFYGSILFRTGTPGEVNGWVASGQDLYRMSIAFYSSPEFYQSE